MIINKIAIIIAMELEAAPIISELALQEVENYFPACLPMKAYSSEKHQDLLLVVNGRCPIHDIDRIGTQAACLSTWETIKLFQPDLIISAGTAGGFTSNRSKIGQVYLSTEHFVYHGRNVPVQGFEHFQYGKYKVLEAHNLAEYLEVEKGVISTSDSIPASQDELEVMHQYQAKCKEMEAAAIAEVAQLAGVDMIALKVITDFVDVPETTEKQFIQNYKLAVSNLKNKLIQAIQFIQYKDKSAI